MEWIKKHYKTILSTLLTAIFVCSMVFLIPFSSSARSVVKDTFTVDSVADTGLMWRPLSDANFNFISPNSEGFCVLQNFDVQNIAVVPYISKNLDLFLDYGLNRLLTFEVNFYIDITESNTEDYLIYLYGADIYCVVDGVTLSENIIDSSINIENIDNGEYLFHCNFTIDPVGLSSINNVQINIASAQFLRWNGSYTFFISKIYDATIDISYIYNTAEDEIYDSLTTPTTDIPVDNSQVSDDADRFNSAVDDYISAEDSINQSIEGIYDTYQNDPLRFGESILGLVDDTKDIANSNVFSAVWSFVKDYPLIYWLVNIAIVFAVLTFLLRR